MLELELGLGEVELDIATEIGANDPVRWHPHNGVFNVGRVRSGFVNVEVGEAFDLHLLLCAGANGAFAVHRLEE